LVVSLELEIIAGLSDFKAKSSIYLRLNPKMQARNSKARAVISTIKFLMNDIRISVSKKVGNKDGNENMFSVKLINESNKCEKATTKAK
jgi:hypothetical protein